MLLLATVVGPRTTGFTTLTSPIIWPLAMLAVMQLLLAIRRRHSAHGFAVAVSVSAALTILLWRPEWLMYRRVMPFHVLLVAAIGCGWAFSDRFARFLSAAGAIALPVTCLVTAVSLQTFGASEPVLLSYFVAMTGLAIVHWSVTRNRWYLAAGLLNAVGGSGGVSWMAFRQLKHQLGADVIQPLLYGLACFLLAALISAHKAGAWSRFRYQTVEDPLNDVE
jgi:hypothetical protein